MMNTEIEETEKLIQQLNEERLQIRDKLIMLKSDRGRILSSYFGGHLMPEKLMSKRKELAYLKEALPKVLFEENPLKGKEVHDHLVGTLKQKLLHGTKSLAEEKHLFKEIKQLEGANAMDDATSCTRVCSSADRRRSKYCRSTLSTCTPLVNVQVPRRWYGYNRWSPMWTMCSISLDQLRREINEKMDEISRTERLQKEKEKLDDDIRSLEMELANVNQKKHAAGTCLLQLREHSEEFQIICT